MDIRNSRNNLDKLALVKNPSLDHQLKKQQNLIDKKKKKYNGKKTNTQYQD